MAQRLPFTAGWILSLSLGAVFLALTPIPVRAADPVFCKPYARAALLQARGALASPHCGAGLQGTRWSVEFAVHYEWCLGASLDAAAAESEARERTRRGCNDR